MVVQNIPVGNPAKNPKGPWFGIRHVQSILLLLLFVTTYAMRSNLSVAIVAMTNSDTNNNPNIPTYNWKNQNIILSSLSWGYIVLHFVAGQLCKKFGVKIVLTATMIVNSVFGIIIPQAAELLGSTGVIICRIIQGLAQGFFFPAVNDMLGKWIPKQERSRLGSFVYVGPSVGVTIGMSCTGFISASSIGWPGSFYIFGALGFVWVFLWLLLGCNEPSKSKYISAEEVKYIESNLGCQKANTKVLKTPYKKILTSVPMWAIVVVGIGNIWGCATLFNDVPMYMEGVLKYDIKSNAILSAAPYMAVMFFNTIFGAFSDFLLNRKIISITNVRKLLTTIGCFGPAIALTVLAFFPGYRVLTVVLLILTIGVNAANNSGHMMNILDLSPNYSGVVMGICNGLISLASMLAPLLAQIILTDTTDTEQWKIIFLVSVAFFALPNLLYLFYASGEVQPWNDNHLKKKKLEEEEVESRRRITPYAAIIDIYIPNVDPEYDTTENA